MSDIFDEISKDIQQEKWMKLWHRYQKPLSRLGVVVVVAGALGWYWQYRQQEIAAEASAAYADAVYFVTQEDSLDKALKRLEDIPQKSGHAYVDLSGLLGASLLAQKGDIEGAMAAYESLIRTTSQLVFKDLALLKLLYLKAEKGDNDEVLARIEPLLKKESPWRLLSLELKASVLKAKGENDAARTLLQEIKNDTQAPDSLRIRASLQLSQV